jgi:hypothetical protein
VQILQVDNHNESKHVWVSCGLHCLHDYLISKVQQYRRGLFLVCSVHEIAVMGQGGLRVFCKGMKAATDVVALFQAFTPPIPVLVETSTL